MARNLTANAKGTSSITYVLLIWILKKETFTLIFLDDKKVRSKHTE